MEFVLRFQKLAACCHAETGWDGWVEYFETKYYEIAPLWVAMGAAVILAPKSWVVVLL